MRIKRVRAVGWRNLAPLDLSFDPSARLNVLFGDNGQGKTNLLEAVYYLSAFRSFRTSQSADLVQVACDEARVAVDVATAHLVKSVEARLQVKATGSVNDVGVVAAVDADASPGARPSGPSSDTNQAAFKPSAARLSVVRTVVVDGKATRGLRAAFGTLSVVLFVPEDLLLVRAPPSVRRRFLDLAIAGTDRSYFDEATRYQKVLASRNALLRSARGGASALLLDTYDEQLARFGARLVMRRRQFVHAIGPRVLALFRSLHADLTVDLGYESDEAVARAGGETETETALLDGLRARRSGDARRGHTTFGPHTDDLAIDLAGRPARAHASQGQLRSIVLALKLAELGHLETSAGETPILLLDDVPSELDVTRRRYLFDALDALKCQAIITVADRSVVPTSDGRIDFFVRDGRIEPFAPQI